MRAGSTPTLRAGKPRRRVGKSLTMAPNGLPFSLRVGGRVTRARVVGPLGPILRTRRWCSVKPERPTKRRRLPAFRSSLSSAIATQDRRGIARRQRGLLGDALAVFPATSGRRSSGVLRAAARSRRAAQRMGEIGRARMGAPGGARRIAERIAAQSPSERLNAPL